MWDHQKFLNEFLIQSITTYFLRILKFYFYTRIKVFFKYGKVNLDASFSLTTDIFFECQNIKHNICIVPKNKKREISAPQKPTLNRSTSSIRAVLPSLTHDWKKLGATDTPSASLVIPVAARSELLAITRKVPNSSTKRRCVWPGSDISSLQERKQRKS